MFNEGTASYKGKEANAPIPRLVNRTTPLSEVSPQIPILLAACHLVLFSRLPSILSFTIIIIIADRP